MKFTLVKTLKQYDVFSKKDTFLLISLLVTLLIGAICQVWYPHLMQQYIDKIDMENQLETMKVLGFSLLGIIILKNSMKLLEVLVSQRVFWNIATELRVNLTQKLLNADYKDLINLSIGELTQTVENDINSLLNFFANVLVKIIVNIFVIIGIIMTVSILNIYIGVFITVFSIISILILKKVNGKAAPLWLKEKEAYSDFFTFYNEIIELTTDIKFVNGESFILKQFDKACKDIIKSRFLASMMGYHLWVASILSFSISTIAVMIISGVLVLNGDITIGTAYMLIYYIEILNGPIEDLRMKLEDLQVSKGSLTRIERIMNLEGSITYGNENFPEKLETIIFKDISFSYKDVNVLENLNLDIKVNNINCIIGKTGSGKTTLIKLLVRLYDCDSGEILINGKNIKEFSKEALKDNIELLSQRKRLIGSRVKDIVNPKGFHNDDKVINTLKRVGLGRWFNNLEGGLDEIISESSLNLSSGEFQRIYVAKVILSTKKIIVMDELTAHIDEEGDNLLSTYLKQMMLDKTIIIIAHNDNTISHYDYILKVEDKNIKVIEETSYVC